MLRPTGRGAYKRIEFCAVPKGSSYVDLMRRILPVMTSNGVQAAVLGHRPALQHVNPSSGRFEWQGRSTFTDMRLTVGAVFSVASDHPSSGALIYVNGAGFLIDTNGLSVWTHGNNFESTSALTWTPNHEYALAISYDTARGFLVAARNRVTGQVHTITFGSTGYTYDGISTDVIVGSDSDFLRGKVSVAWASYEASTMQELVEWVRDPFEMFEQRTEAPRSRPAPYMFDYTATHTVDRTQHASTDLTHFPVPFFITHNDLKLVANGGKMRSGNDIVFTSDLDGLVRIPHEIEAGGYDGTAGTVRGWYARNLTGASDTVTYVRIGHRGAAGAQGNAPYVWDDASRLVVHSGDGATLDLSDSSRYGNAGENHGATAAAGLRGGSAAFNGSSQYVKVPYSSSLDVPTTAFTVAALIYQTSNPGGNAGIFTRYDTNGLLIFDTYGLRIELSVNNTIAGAVDPATIPLNTWVRAVGRYDGVNLTVFKDGVNVAQTAYGTPVTWVPGEGAAIGALRAESTPILHFPGRIDEVRWDGVARSDAWIAADAVATMDPDDFATLGAFTPNVWIWRTAPEVGVTVLRGSIPGVQSGDALIVQAWLTSENRQISSIADTNGTGWARADRHNDGGAVFAADIWYLDATTDGEHVVTVTLDSAATGFLVLVRHTAATFDKAGGAGGYAASVASGDLSPAQAETSVLAFGAAYEVGSALAALAAPWTEIGSAFDASPYNSRVFRQLPGTTNPIGATFAWGSGSGPIVSQLVILSLSGGGGGSTTFTYTMVGGLQLSGVGTVSRVAHPNPSGGIALSGTPAVARQVRPSASGGVVLSGIAPSSYARLHMPSGGIVFSGAALPVHVRTPIGAGGIQLGGEASESISRAVVGAGGLVLSGAALSIARRSVVGDGGIVLSGHAIERVLRVASGVGGIVFNGAAETDFTGTVLYTYTGDGGLSLAGDATRRLIRVAIAAGGIQLSGTASAHVLRVVLPAGGLALGGSAAPFVAVRRVVPVGGLVLGGASAAALLRVHIVSGGIVLGGTAAPSRRWTAVPVGGIVLGGALVPIMTRVVLPVGGLVLSGTGSAVYIFGGTVLAAWTARVRIYPLLDAHLVTFPLLDATIRVHPNE